MTNPNPILIAGPTASGKSALALRLAERTDGIVVNADALQVYDNWRVLTARPDDTDLARAEHRLYGHVDKRTTYSVGDWLREVEPLLRLNRQLIIVGGTGLYLTTLTRGLAEIPATPDRIRAEGNERMAAEGIDYFGAYVRDNDPDLYVRMDRNNPMRLQRAWEVHQTTGRPLSAWQADTPPPRLPLGDTVPLNLVSQREWLNDRISNRFRQMIDNGALDEVEANRHDWDPSLPSSKALGASELMDYLYGIITLEDAVEKGIIATRQFAKRQRSWFRSNMAEWRQLSWPPVDPEMVANDVISMT